MDAVDALLERLETPFHIADALERNYFTELPIDVADAVAVGKLPRHHEGPFDRRKATWAPRR
jgi:PIN domain nuclease of toxin-antitoxin system